MWHAWTTHVNLNIPGHDTMVRNVTDRGTFGEVKYQTHVNSCEYVNGKE